MQDLKTPPKKTVLIARFLALGDVTYVLPIVEALSQAGFDVDLLTGADFHVVGQLSPFVRKVISINGDSGLWRGPKPDWIYDIVVDLHSRADPLPHEFEHALDSIQGREYVGYHGSPQLKKPNSRCLPSRRHGHGAAGEYIIDYYARAFEGLLVSPLGSGRFALPVGTIDAMKRRFGSRFVCLAVGARYAWKQWPAHRYGELARLLSLEGLPAVLVGHQFDRAFLDEAESASLKQCEVFLGGISEISSVMAASGVVVANCSGLSCVAAAAGAKVVCIHSHTLPSMYAPWGVGHLNIVGEASSPCACSPPYSPFPDIPCGRLIEAATVLAAVRSIFDRS